MKSYYINFRVSRYGMGEDQRAHIKHREIYIVVKINTKSLRCQNTIKELKLRIHKGDCLKIVGRSLDLGFGREHEQ
jgi:hypothetical protein